MKVEFLFRINGTDRNPYAHWGLKHNPFPSAGKVEVHAQDMALQSLGGEPVKSSEDIRTRLAGRFSSEIIDRIVASGYVRGVQTQCRLVIDDQEKKMWFAAKPVQERPLTRDEGLAADDAETAEVER